LGSVQQQGSAKGKKRRPLVKKRDTGKKICKKKVKSQTQHRSELKRNGWCKRGNEGRSLSRCAPWGNLGTENREPCKNNVGFAKVGETECFLAQRKDRKTCRGNKNRIREGDSEKKRSFLRCTTETQKQRSETSVDKRGTYLKRRTTCHTKKGEEKGGMRTVVTLYSKQAMSKLVYIRSTSSPRRRTEPIRDISRHEPRTTRKKKGGFYKTPCKPLCRKRTGWEDDQLHQGCT